MNRGINKMSKFKKWISVIMITSLLLNTTALAAVPASVESEKSEVLSSKEKEIVTGSEDDFRYTVYNGEATITGYSGSGGEVVIPSKLGGYAVTNIGNLSFEKNRSLTSVTIPDSVTSIGNGAFINCYNLTSITIPDGVTSIGQYAFRDCNALMSVTIPDSVTRLQYQTFASCHSLTSVTIPDRVTEIDNECFKNCTSLIEFTISNSVKYIGMSSFEGCCSLTSVTIPDSLREIGYTAFSGCTKLAEITIPDSVIKIAGSAFKDTAYYNDKSNWENNELYIGNHLIEIIGISDISGDYKIKNGTVSVASGVFRGCTGLTEITIPDSVKVISEGVFRGCTGLTEIIIPDSVKVISEGAFSGCTGLTEIIIPDSVTRIGGRAFSGCTALTEITIPDSIITIGYWAFEDTAYYNDKSNWESNVLYIGKHLMEAIGDISADYKIKNGTLTIAQSAFNRSWYYDIYLRSVTIPDSVIHISDWAFQECWDITVIIPESVTIIGNDIFFAESGNTNSTIVCAEDSYAETYAKENDIPYELLVKRKLNSIKVAALPAKTIYLEGKEDLDVSGGKISLYYDDATSETIDMTVDMIENFDNTVIGEQILTVTCGDQSTSFTVTVVAAIRVIVGDSNNDGRVDTTDARMVLQYAVGKTGLMEMQLNTGDVNADGKIDTTDARLILQYAVGKIHLFPQNMPYSVVTRS